MILTAKAFLDKNPKADRSGDSAGDVDGAVPLLHQRPDAAGDQRYARGDERTMNLRRVAPRFSQEPPARLIVSFSIRRRDAGRAVRQASSRRAAQISSIPGSPSRPTAASPPTAARKSSAKGISTAQQQLVAEELSVPFDRVKLIHCDTALTPDQGTLPAASRPRQFQRRQSRAGRRDRARSAAAAGVQKLGVPVDRLTATDGVISDQGDPSKRVTYGELVGGKKFNLALDPKAKRKPPAEWTVLGKPIRRPDLPAMATGQFEFVHNVRLPGMLHGRVVRPPAVGATLVSVDESSIAGMPGVVKVVVKKNFVGVVAEKPWQAIQAAAKLKVTWTPGSGLPEQSRHFTTPAQAALARHAAGRLERRRPEARALGAAPC